MPFDTRVVFGSTVPMIVKTATDVGADLTGANLVGAVTSDERPQVQAAPAGGQIDPLPGQRPVFMERIIVPRHPTGTVPIVSAFIRDRACPHSHHVERRRDQDESLDVVALLRHQPRDPAT